MRNNTELNFDVFNAFYQLTMQPVSNVIIDCCLTLMYISTDGCINK